MTPSTPPPFPTGTITFVFTDIEGSTRLWETVPDPMRAAVARHDVLLHDLFTRHGGRVFRTVGDAFCVAFSTAPDALAAAVAAQIALCTEGWEGLPQALSVRIALHTGAAEQRDNDYFGPPLNRVARLLSTGHGGQILLSEATQALTRDTLPDSVTLRDLGEQRLKDLGRPEQVFQVCHPALPLVFAPLRSLSSPHLPNNLPPQMTSFVGREKELTETVALLSRTRLLTLTGSGGCGKTRLSLQAAAEVLDEYPDGAWLVELAPLTDPDLVTHAAAKVLGIKESHGEPLLTTLAGALENRRTLLVLDNCEHVLDACIRLADTLLHACPTVKILASSREGLGISGEQTYRVPSLALPDPKRVQTVEGVSQYEAVRLFVERALLARSDFSVTNTNAPALAQLCCRLDGIPLALELAAARVKSLSVEEIGERLDSRFRLLTGGSRTALPRQQTLRGAIDWSYDLLTDEEKRLLQRLSVFAGGWTLEAAEAVCADSPDETWEILDLLTGLVDKSLVPFEEKAGHTRYRLLESVREYARDRLLEGGTEAATDARDRHLAFYRTYVENAERRLWGREATDWLNRLETEHDNLRAALRYGIDRQKTVVVQRLAAALRLFWFERGYLRAGQAWYTEVLGLPLSSPPTHEETAARAHALLGLGEMTTRQGNLERATAAYGEALADFQALGDASGIAAAATQWGWLAYCQHDFATAHRWYTEGLAGYRALSQNDGISRALNGLGVVCCMQGSFTEAQALFSESLALCREAGDKKGALYATGNLGYMFGEQGDFATARNLGEEGLALAREMGNRYSTADCLRGLAWVSLSAGDYSAAHRYLTEALATYRDLGGKQWVLLCLYGFALLASASDPDRAAHLLGSATALYRQMGLSLPVEDSHRTYIAAARSALGDRLYDTAFTDGETWTLEQALSCALDPAAC